MSCFNDKEISLSNTYAAGTLDFELSSENDFSPEVAPGQSSERAIEVINHSATDYKYKVRVEENSVGVLCNYLYLEDGINSKPLNSFVSDEVLFSEKQAWTFKASLDGTGTFWQNEECQFDLVFEGQQENCGGFSDIEIIKNIITAGEFGERLLISKVYYDVCDRTNGSCGGNKGKELKYEWIELYNPTGQIINLKNWQICNSDQCETINPNNASVNIFPSGYAIIAHDASILKHWDILNGGVEATVIYQLGGNFQMNNDSDMLTLKDPAGLVVDQMNWGAPDSGWSNYNSDLWNPGVSAVAKGRLLGRVPVGKDTDLPADWYDLELPSVTVTYPSEQNIVWHIGEDYEITWEALNNNSDNDLELTIDIYYSNNSGKSWGVVEKGTKNDGSYTWENIRPFIFTEDGKPYSTLSSRARIKVVAVDYTRNFMLRNSDMSDNDFCPPIDCDLFTPEEIEVLVEMGVLDESECSVNDAGDGGNDIGSDDLADGADDNANNTDGDTDDISQEEEEDINDDINNIGDGDDVSGDVNNLDTVNEESEDDDADESKTEDTEEDAKEEEFVLTPKEEILPDDDDDDDAGDGKSNDDAVADASINSDNDISDGEDDEEGFEELGSDVEEEIEKINNDNGDLEDNSTENNLSKNSVDCVQAAK